MQFDDLEYEQKGKIAYLSFSRPHRKNALGDATTGNLITALSTIEQDDTIKVVVLTGKGDSFCAGGDFKDTFQRGAERSEEDWAERIRRGPNRLAEQLRLFSKPIIASINGVAVGGGATIALACDLRIASTEARFAFPFARLGLTPEFGCSYLLPRVVGLGNALELLLLADFIDADEALRVGLINKVVPHAELAATTESMASRLSEFSSTALKAIKNLAHKSLYSDFTTSLEYEAVELGRAFTSTEHHEAVRSFIERKAQAAKFN